MRKAPEGLASALHLRTRASLRGHILAAHWGGGAGRQGRAAGPEGTVPAACAHRLPSRPLPSPVHVKRALEAGNRDTGVWGWSGRAGRSSPVRQAGAAGRTWPLTQRLCAGPA